MSTFIPMDATQLNRKQRADALASLIHLTEKRDGRVKSRGCADSSKQRTFLGYNKEDAASPTVSTEAVFVTSVIDSK